MKKLLVLLLLFVTSLFISYAQPSKVTYVDSLKAVTVNVNSESKKQLDAVQILQTQFVKLIEDQSSYDSVTATGLTQFTSDFSTYVKNVEEKNKADCQPITPVLSKLGYPESKVKKIIKIERWLNFTVVVLVFAFLLWSFSGETLLYKRETGLGIALRLLYALSLSATFYVLFLKFLTLLFNGGYYVIKELIKFYS